MIRQLRISLLAFLLVCFSFEAVPQTVKTQFQHVEPPFWWTGMKNPDLQILFHHKSENLQAYTVTLEYDGVELKERKNVENPHYAFLYLNISPDAKPGKVPIIFKAGKKTIRYEYEIRAKSNDPARINGFNSSDVIYLIMPDRFANGDPRNDSIPGMFEGVNRRKDGARHGGDLQGIINHLDYVDDLGVTALWLNPVLENNQRSASYHGYAITDLYQVDKRFGGNEKYLELIEKCHTRGLKVIQDMVMNHIGNEHWLMHDLPEKDWVHQFPQFTRSNYRSTVISDPYKAASDQQLMSNGWFDTTMPDVNQRNPLFADYLIQNTIWWIEYAGIDGIRMDTYPYPDKEFMARWAREVLEEYPKFNIVGEVWIDNSATTAYWQRGNNNRDGYNSHLPSVTDFPFFFAVPKALTEPGGWDTGMSRLHELFSNDFVYPDPGGNVVFLDNHDVSRFFLLCGRDLRRYKLGLTLLLTTRGIPQLYYGSELLMDGDGGHHPNVRLDFPGGWKDDKVNAFRREGRTAEQNEAVDFVRTLLHWRRKEDVIHNGNLTHYLPQNNVYVYFRYDANKTVMIILNGNDTETTVDPMRFRERIGNERRGREVLSDKVVDLGQNIPVPALSAMVVELNSPR